MSDMAHDENNGIAAEAVSPLGQAVARVGDRWALLLVHALLGGPRRFNDLVSDVPGIAPNVLSRRLKHLEQTGVVMATPYSQRPLRVVYELTGAGQELAGALRLLAQWGGGDDVEVLRHGACGTALEARWYCPTCATVVEDDGGELRYL